MFATPDISHLKREDFDKVYEPAEDTFLFLDALEKDADYLNHLCPSICVEVGSGSGMVSTFLGNILSKPSLQLCTDINPSAADVSQRTGHQNNVVVNPVLTDLCSALLQRLRGNVDVLLFNPPYVVTPPEEVGSSGIEASWAGGDRGRQVIDRLLPYVPQLLSKSGVFYMVIIKENNSGEIEDIMKGFGLTTEVVMSRKSGPERLSILKFTRQSSGG